MGGIKDVMNMLPGMGKLKLADGDIDEKQIDRMKAIIRSMTPKERQRPEILNASRRRRIAAGSGTRIQDVNQLIKQFEQTTQMMKQFKNKKRLPFGF